MRVAYYKGCLASLSAKDATISKLILKEVKARLGFLSNVGLDYLTLDRPTGTLSGGEAQRIQLATQIGSSLVGVLYVLDEPSIGLAPIIVQEVCNTIRRLKETGITLLLVEQFAKSALEVADYAYVMDRGHIAIEGTPAHLSEDERVLAAYLG